MNCTTANPCTSQIKGCAGDSDDCILQCYGAASCDDVTYNCNSNDAQKPCKMLCYGEGSCENAVYTSSNTQSAVLECNNLNACRQLNMTSAGSTTVKCQGINACDTLVVTVDSTFSQNNIECHDFANSCNDVKISVNGGSLGSLLSCMGTDGQCSSVIFNCTGTTGDCAVDCAALESCDTSQIICNSNNICTSNQENAFEVIGGEIIPTTSPSIAPTIPAVLQKYVFIDNATDWFSAQKHCENEYQSNLATIVQTVDFDNINIYSNILSNRWIGLNNYYQNKWQWIDGYNCDYVDNTTMCEDDKHWAVNQPIDRNNTCSAMTAQYNGMYSNVNCTEQYPFLCQLTKRIDYICGRDINLKLRRVFASVSDDQYISNRTAYNEGFLLLSVMNNYWYITDENNNTLGQCYINGTEFILPTECMHWQWMSVNANLARFTNLTFVDCSYSDICIGGGLEIEDYEDNGWDVLIRQYEFQYFDFKRNGPIYFSPGNILYVYPFTFGNGNTTTRRYIVNDEIIDMTDLTTADACCVIEYDDYDVYDILDCNDNWGKYSKTDTETVFQPQREIKTEFNCNPTPYPTTAPTITPGVNYMRFYCYYSSEDPFLDNTFNLADFINVFKNITLSALFDVDPFDPIHASIEHFDICEVFVDYTNITNIVPVLGPNNCPFVNPPSLELGELPDGPYYAAANFKIYASPNELESFGEQVIRAFYKGDFIGAMNDYLMHNSIYKDLDIQISDNGIYVFNLNASVTHTPTTISPTISPTIPISIRDLIFKILYKLKNWKSWTEDSNYPLFAQYLRNATLKTFYELYTSYNDLITFDICAVFNDKLVNKDSTCMYDNSDDDEDNNDEDSERQFSSVGPFQIEYIGTFDSLKSIRNTFEGTEFKYKLDTKMNELLSLSSPNRRLLAIDFSVVSIEIIDTENMTISSTLYEEPKTNDENDDWLTLSTLFQVAFIAVILLFAIVIVLAYIYSKCIWINHFFRVTALVTAAVHVMDMLSDVFFTINASFDAKKDFKLLIIFIASACFIFIPITTTIIQLWKHMKKHWLTDDKLRSWLSENTALLYFVSIITGSSFTAIELFNSNLFSLPQFDMGLTRTELMGYQYKRVYSIVLLENIPQLILQSSYIYFTGGEWDIITATAITFTIISIIVMIISMFVQKEILFNQDLVMIEFDVTGASVVAKGDKCRNIIRLLHEQLSTILGLDKGLVEIVRPYNIPNGLKIHLNIHIVNDDDIEKGNDICDKFENIVIKALNSRQIQSSLIDCWKLDGTPTVSNLSVTTKESKKREMMYTDNEGPNTEMIETQITNSQMMNGEGIVEGVPSGAAINSMSISENEKRELMEDMKQDIGNDEEDIIADVNTIGGPTNNNNDVDLDIVADVNTIGGVTPYED